MRSYKIIGSGKVKETVFTCKRNLMAEPHLQLFVYSQHFYDFFNWLHSTTNSVHKLNSIQCSSSAFSVHLSFQSLLIVESITKTYSVFMSSMFYRSLSKSSWSALPTTLQHYSHVSTLWSFPKLLRLSLSNFLSCMKQTPTLPSSCFRTRIANDASSRFRFKSVWGPIWGCLIMQQIPDASTNKKCNKKLLCYTLLVP